ncbi:MAG: hypothetical protein ACOC1K_02405 [Nanoarchaeota archaeon]
MEQIKMLVDNIHKEVPKFYVSIENGYKPKGLIYINDELRFSTEGVSTLDIIFSYCAAFEAALRLRK